MLGLLLGGCANAPVRAVKCPALKPMPLTTIEVVEKACKAGDTASCEYVVALDKHHQKLDRCGG